MSEPLTLVAIPLGAEGVADRCTAIQAVADGAAFGPGDAQLQLGAGTPRFYVMELAHRQPLVKQITRHQRVTQCLASADGRPFWIALAPPEQQGAVIATACLQLVRVEPGEAIALHCGTWHAGPFFPEPSARFFNLELADTNTTDHHSRPLDRPVQLELR